MLWTKYVCMAVSVFLFHFLRKLNNAVRHLFYNLILVIMKKNGKNEELQSRREFFKKAAKGALPILGAIVLANAPAIANATEKEDAPMGCKYMCANTCLGTCKGSCDINCNNTCYRTCSGSCDRTCSGSCKYSSR